MEMISEAHEAQNKFIDMASEWTLPQKVAVMSEGLRQLVNGQFSDEFKLDPMAEVLTAEAIILLMRVELERQGFLMDPPISAWADPVGFCLQHIDLFNVIGPVVREYPGQYELFQADILGRH